MLKPTILLICLVNFIICEGGFKTSQAEFRYKSNVTLDCSEHGNVEFYRKSNLTDQGPVKLQSDNLNLQIASNVLYMKDLRKEEIYAEYYCVKDNKTVHKFENKILPFIYKPEKPSQTVTEGGNIDIKCNLLYGNENGANASWVWTKNGTVLADDEKYKIVSNNSETTLTVSRVDYSDKGDFECELKNEYGTHNEKVTLRVKDALAALWPFLAIVAEVIILCLIILIYEKKCSKKAQNNEDDNEQAQNLMGKDTNSDLKKRNTKA